MNVHSEKFKKNHTIPPPRVNTIKLFSAVSSYIFKFKSVKLLQILFTLFFATF